jgi:3-hydroxyisobutyrate dehydrogenase-like beta-hydroxyacid dehydrogenase
MQEKIGFIGLGAMGAPMVLRLLHAGHRVVVYDLDSGAVVPRRQRARRRLGPRCRSLQRQRS